VFELAAAERIVADHRRFVEVFAASRSADITGQ
jgi:hypothetical protein